MKIKLFVTTILAIITMAVQSQPVKEHGHPRTIHLSRKKILASAKRKMRKKKGKEKEAEKKEGKRDGKKGREMPSRSKT